VDFLNKQMERTEVLIIEARQFCQGELKILVPTLFGYTEQARRIKKTVIVEPTGKPRRKWDRASIVASLEQQDNPQRLANAKELLGLVDNNPSLLGLGYGTGQTGSIVLKNNVGKGIFYVFGDGSTQLTATGYFHEYIEFFKSLEEKYRPFLQWKAELAVGKLPGLKKPLGELTAEEMEKLKAFILEIAQELKDQVYT